MKNLLKTLGPGILFASTAIGVSHLVQSTQAGANYGFTLLWAILLANLFKYPFFEYGSRYANATGTSIIEGYGRLGKPAVASYFLMTLVSMFIVTAAVGSVTAGFMQNLFGLSQPITTVIVLFLICLILLISNNFALLDRLIKFIGLILLLSTLIAFAVVLVKGPQGNRPLWSMNDIPVAGYLAFLIPLMGWMPTALDLSSWNSLWTLERIKQTGYHPSLKETRFEFNMGYILSALLAICFVTLGAFIMFGTPLTFSDSGAKFSAEVIDLYTQTFGNWATVVMSISAFSIMFGTCVAVFDGYSRCMSETWRVLKGETLNAQQGKRRYRILLLLISIGAFVIIVSYQSNPKGFKELVSLATSISFVFAPVVAILNYVLVQKKYIHTDYVPGRMMQWLSIGGIIFLSLFTLLYLFQDWIIPFFE